MRDLALVGGLAAALALFVFSQLLPAQYFTPDQKLLRASTRVSWHGLSGEQVLAIDHGQPKWNASYEQLLAGRSVQHARLGNGAWTTLQAGVAMTFGNTRVPAGRWYLGLRRDAAASPTGPATTAPATTPPGTHAAAPTPAATRPSQKPPRTRTAATAKPKASAGRSGGAAKPKAPPRGRTGSPAKPKAPPPRGRRSTPGAPSHKPPRPRR